MTPPDQAAESLRLLHTECPGHQLGQDDVSKLSQQSACSICLATALGCAYQHGLAAGRQEPAARLQKLLSAYRAKRAVDGLNDRPWDASKHLEAEETIVELESAIRLSQDMPMQPTPPATGREGT